MSILNHTNDGLYSMVAVLYRTLARMGPLRRETLLATCTGGIDPGNGPKVADALRRWTELGLFTESSGLVRISPGCEASDGANDLDLTEALRCAALRVVFLPKNIDQVWSTEGSADFARGIAWWMAQDAWSTDTSTTALLHLESGQVVSPEVRIVRNDVRTARLREWARFLGFGWTTARSDIELDPTGAIDRVLDSVLPTVGEHVAAGDFITALAHRLPVLDQGTCRQAVEEQLKPGVWTSTPAGWVSSTLGRALRQLDGRRLVLHKSADARTAMRIPGVEGTKGRAWKEFTHVYRNGSTR